MMFVGTCEITGDDEADHDVPADDIDDSDDVAVITTGGRWHIWIASVATQAVSRATY